MSLAYNPPERLVANNMCNAIFKFKDVYKTQNEAHQPYKEIEQSSVKREFTSFGGSHSTCTCSLHGHSDLSGGVRHYNSLLAHLTGCSL